MEKPVVRVDTRGNVVWWQQPYLDKNGFPKIIKMDCRHLELKLPIENIEMREYYRLASLARKN